MKLFKKCDICQTEVPVNEICKCLRDKIEDKRVQQKLEETKSNLTVLSLKEGDVIIFHVPENIISQLGDKATMDLLNEKFKDIAVFIFPKTIDIKVITKEVFNG